MIRLDRIVKRFGKFTALDNVSCEIGKGSIYGLVGINGAGKSTLLRVMTGIYEPDEGCVSYDGVPLSSDPTLKGRFAFVPDELYLPNNSCIADMAKKYRLLYNGKFNEERLVALAAELSLGLDKPFNSFSKGMKRQAATVLALALETEYIFFDETFDGLDPFKRNYIKRIITEEVRQRGVTAIITSHSLRELEGFCDKLAVVDKGGLVFESEVAGMEGGVRVQVAFAEDYDITKFSSLEIIDFSKQGKVATFTVKGDEKQIREVIEPMSPLLLEILPLSLEDVFTFELSKRGVETFFRKEAEQ